jgi:acyl transferase domain-containing protein
VPGMFAGHSAGEWSAMFAAGAFPASHFEHFAERMGPGGFELPDLVFAAVAMPAHEVYELIDGVERVVVSHHNSPQQTILCGDEDAVMACLARIADPAVSRRVLPFRSGFHSPMLGPYLPAITSIFDEMPLQRPVLPIWSATTVAPYPQDEVETRELMTRHLLEPVRFNELIDEMYAAGARTFIQIGCGSLTRFVTDVLGSREHLAVSAGTRNRPYLAQIRHVAAASWAIGLRPDMTALEPESPVLAEYRAALAGVSASLDTVYRAWRTK